MMAMMTGFTAYRKAFICGRAPKRTYTQARTVTIMAEGRMKQQPPRISPGHPPRTYPR